jgi:hypothetical protein
MARLTVSLLGWFDLKLDDQPLTALVAGEVRVLLAVLVLDAARPWPRFQPTAARCGRTRTSSGGRYKASLQAHPRWGVGAAQAGGTCG